jgi:serine protease Do
MSTKKSNSAIIEFAEQFGNAVDTASQSIVAIHARRRIPSSGIAWRNDIVVSASHTVRRDDDISITLASGQSVTATVAGRDPATDLVALRVNDAALPTAIKANAGTARVGLPILAIGRPGANVSASFGIISAIGESWRSSLGTRIERLLRLDLAIYDGFSGGALIDASGSVIGLNTSGLARGAPMSLPAAVVDRVVDELLEHGHVYRGFIGVALHPVSLSTSIVTRHQLTSDAGLVVMSVAEGSPADSTLMVGDVLVEANGQPLKRPIDFLDALFAMGPGAHLELKLVRGGALQAATVTPIDRAAA